MIVVDASALAEALVGHSSLADQVRAELAEEELAAPHVIDLECLSVMRGLLRGKKVDLAEASDAIDLLARMALTRYEHRPLARRIWELRGNAWPYDASYLALAELLDVDLVTVDGKLERVPGIRCTVRNLREE